MTRGKRVHSKSQRGLTTTCRYLTEETKIRKQSYIMQSRGKGNPRTFDELHDLFLSTNIPRKRSFTRGTLK